MVKAKKQSILKDFENEDFALYFDEKTDTNGRYILNIMAKVLNGSETKIMLMDTVELAITNTDNVVDAIKIVVLSSLEYKTPLKSTKKDDFLPDSQIKKKLHKYLKYKTGSCIRI